MAGTMKIKIAKLKNLLRLFFRSFISFRLQMKLYSLLLSRKKKEQNSALQWLKHLADPRLYRQADPDAAQLLFKKYVTVVHLEISSFCNRSCLYCPNGQLPGKRTLIQGGNHLIAAHFVVFSHTVDVLFKIAAA